MQRNEEDDDDNYLAEMKNSVAKMGWMFQKQISCWDDWNNKKLTIKTICDVFTIICIFEVAFYPLTVRSNDT